MTSFKLGTERGQVHSKTLVHRGLAFTTEFAGRRIKLVQPGADVRQASSGPLEPR